MPAVADLRPFAAFYFSYFAFQGLFGPFWGLYLESLSFSTVQISVLMALSTLARIVAPGLWGWLADRRGRRRSIILSTSLLSALAGAVILILADIVSRTIMAPEDVPIGVITGLAGGLAFILLLRRR